MNSFPPLADSAALGRPQQAHTATSAPRGAFPETVEAFKRQRADHRLGPPLHPRPLRLVRRLLDHGRRLRRPRRLRPRAISFRLRRRSSLAAGPRTTRTGPTATSTSAARAPPRSPPPTAPTCSQPGRSRRSWTARESDARHGERAVRRLVSPPSSCSSLAARPRSLMAGASSDQGQASATRSCSTTPSASPRAATSAWAA